MKLSEKGKKRMIEEARGQSVVSSEVLGNYPDYLDRVEITEK